MSLELDKLSYDMMHLYNNILLKSNILSLNVFKEGLLDKKKNIDLFITRLNKINKGSISKEIIRNISIISNDFKGLYDNFDDKLMIFIIGDGNTGKSTVINSLVGREVAKTNFLPTTWKIDVYCPDIEEDTAIIKYIDGREECLNITKAREKIDIEEQKSKDGKKIYNAKLKECLKNIKNKEEIDENKRFLSKKYLYKSDISEVRWPVKLNWLLERCLLVDTPGLNQQLNSLDQIGDANNYYQKADGVIWLLNATTISSKSADELLKELDGNLENVGGLRDNIIGVINRIDLIEENGGSDAVNKVYNDAKNHFSDRFTDIICLSAKKAYQGVKNQDKDLIKESRLEDLQNAINKIFLSKADKIKSQAKLQGSNKLIKSTKSQLDRYKDEIKKYKGMYISNKNSIKKSKDDLIVSIYEDLEKVIEKYLNDVSSRLNLYIDQLANGKGIDFIKNDIYKLEELELLKESFIADKKLEINNNSIKWQKIAAISEYKYIKPKIKENFLSISMKISLDGVNTSVFFTPSQEGTIFSGLGNLIGKGLFFIRKTSIKANIYSTISEQCEKIKESLLSEVVSVIDRNYDNCKEILNDTFKDLLFDFNDVENVISSIDNLYKNIDLELKHCSLEDIVGISGKDEYLRKYKNSKDNSKNSSKNKVLEKVLEKVSKPNKAMFNNNFSALKKTN